ncbi:AI-2E family transporter [Bacteroidota bacterium]
MKKKINQMNNTKTTNTLLLIIVIPLIFYILKILSFIFIPLILSMFIALMFLPLMRWLKKHRVPKLISIIIVILIIAGILKTVGELIQLSSKEFLSADGVLFEKVKLKLISFIVSIEDFFGIQHIQGKNRIIQFFQKGNIINKFGPTLDFIGDTITMTLMTVFFAILWLSESINFQKLLNNTILKQKFSSIKVFVKIEKDLIKFVVAKFIISLFTGVCFTLACLLFDISFPIFWGLFAFALNFIQMIGSVISVITLSLFALVELDPTGTLLLFIIIITGVQLLMGGILEPVFMGKSFSINVITILIMLMFWGFLWGVPGMIMSIPITVFLKIILEQYSGTKIIAGIMSGPEKHVLISRKIEKNKG